MARRPATFRLFDIASDLVRMAAFQQAVEAGREAYGLGLPEIPDQDQAHATSPLTGFLV